MRIRRRLFGLVTALAMARLSFSGVIAPCTPAGGHSGKTPTHGAFVAAADVHAGHQPACSGEGGGSCESSGPRVCTAMSSCTVALIMADPATTSVTATPQRQVPAALGAPRHWARAPEPPPPRA